MIPETFSPGDRIELTRPTCTVLRVDADTVIIRNSQGREVSHDRDLFLSLVERLIRDGATYHPIDPLSHS